MRAEQLSAREARAVALIAQGIGRRPRTVGKTTLRRLLQQQGVVQLDSVNAVARTHEIVPFSRLGPYRTADLLGVVYRERTMFEYWAHAMSWVPMAEFRYFLPRMERHRANPRSWWKEVREQHGPLYPLVLERLRAEGPLGAAHFEDPRIERGTWWDLKPAKLVLEDLFDQGILMVADRRSGFQRIYDLAERVLPPEVDVSRPSDDEVARHFVRRAANVLGVASVSDLADTYRISVASARSAAEALVEAGCLVQVQVEGWRDRTYAPPALLDLAPNLPRHRPVLLSPFDPLIWERKRLQRLFRFDYRIEIYTPESKRRYGYYVLPLLARGAMIGRVDARNDRIARVLRIPAVHFEPGAKSWHVESAAAAVCDLARFLQSETIVVERTDPGWSLEPLHGMLRADATGAVDV